MGGMAHQAAGVGEDVRRGRQAGWPALPCIVRSGACYPPLLHEGNRTLGLERDLAQPQQCFKQVMAIDIMETLI